MFVTREFVECPEIYTFTEQGTLSISIIICQIFLLWDKTLRNGIWVLLINIIFKDFNFCSIYKWNIKNRFGIETLELFVNVNLSRIDFIKKTNASTYLEKKNGFLSKLKKLALRNTHFAISEFNLELYFNADFFFFFCTDIVYLMLVQKYIYM